LENYNIRKIVFARGWERGGRQGWDQVTGERVARARKVCGEAEKKNGNGGCYGCYYDV